MNAIIDISTVKLRQLIEEDKWLQKLFMKHNYVCEFDNKDWWLCYKDMFLKYFDSKTKRCKKNVDINLCKQNIPGLQFVIDINDEKLSLSSIECACNLVKKIQSNYLYYDFPNNNLRLQFNNCNYHINTKHRRKLLGEFAEFLSKEKINQKHNNNSSVIDLSNINSTINKGIYIYGPPGTGKTFSSILLANKLALMNKKVMFISVPNLIRILKKTYKEQNNFSKGLDRLCLEADILFLDDIGGELVSKWARDELLFNILNSRLDYFKTTFFTSNYSIADLQKIYSSLQGSQKKDYNIEDMKAKRILRRITSLSTIQFLG